MPRSSRRLPIIATKHPPLETRQLRGKLKELLGLPLSDFVVEPPTDRKGRSISLGAVKWGVYAFLDFDGEPIYVGQTRESLGTRIRRHLTNQRTDAVAMSVLDPFEVRFLRLWPLPEFQGVGGKPKENPQARAAADRLNSLERAVFLQLVQTSRFKKILNEKDPPDVVPCAVPAPIERDIIPQDVLSDREHPDVRIARRAQTLARLSAIISGREVAGGLRRAMVTQAERLAWLARSRFEALGGEAIVKHRSADEPTETALGGDAGSEA